MPPHDEAVAFAAVAADLMSEPDLGRTAARIVARCVDLLPGSDHAALTVRHHRSPVTLASTADVAARADALQRQLGEGPCLSVADEGPVRAGDIARDGRWPHWGPGAAHLGLQSVLSLPLLAGSRPQGTLTAYSHRPDRFADPDAIEVALVYATHAANALSAARLVTDLRTALSSRHTIGEAQGVVMERFGLTEPQSFTFLCRLASSTETKLRDVAADIAATGEVPTATGDVVRRVEPTQRSRRKMSPSTE